MLVDVSTEIEIQRNVREVSAFAISPDNVPAWYVNIQSVEWQSQPPLQRGSKIAFIAQFMGRQLRYTYEVIELVPEKKLVMRTHEGPFPMETIYVWQALSENRTRMTLQNRGQPKGFSKWLAPFMKSAMRRANRKDLERLRQRLEATQPLE